MFHYTLMKKAESLSKLLFMHGTTHLSPAKNAQRQEGYVEM